VIRDTHKPQRQIKLKIKIHGTECFEITVFYGEKVKKSRYRPGVAQRVPGS